MTLSKQERAKDPLRGHKERSAMEAVAFANNVLTSGSKEAIKILRAIRNDVNFCLERVPLYLKLTSRRNPNVLSYEDETAINMLLSSSADMESTDIVQEVLDFVPERTNDVIMLDTHFEMIDGGAEGTSDQTFGGSAYEIGEEPEVVNFA